MDAMSGTLPIGAMPPTPSVNDLGGNPRTHATDSAVPVRDADSQTLLDREAFLKLLVAQLKYQDPSKPIDSSELISQSAQLSVVDKLSEIAAVLTASAATEQLSMAGSVVGKQISFYGTDGMPTTGTVSHVMFEAGEVTLGVGDLDVPFDAVLAVFDRPQMPAAPSPYQAPYPSAPAPVDPTPTAPDAAPVEAEDPSDLPPPTGTDAVDDPDQTGPGDAGTDPSDTDA